MEKNEDDSERHDVVKRTEKQVLEELSQDQKDFLRRVLEIERAKLHISDKNATVDELLDAVKGIIR